jgi:hypothetical protein
MDIRLMNNRPAGHRALTWIPPLAAGAVVLTAVDWIGTSQGWWWVLLLASMVLGAVVGRWRALLIAAATAAASWGAILIIVATEGSVPRIAQVAGALAGLSNGAGPVVIAVTVLFAALLGAAGGWLGVAARRVVRPVARPVAPVAADPVTVTSPAEPAAEAFRN